LGRRSAASGFAKCTEVFKVSVPYLNVTRAFLGASKIGAALVLVSGTGVGHGPDQALTRDTWGSPSGSSRATAFGLFGCVFLHSTHIPLPAGSSAARGRARNGHEKRYLDALLLSVTLEYEAVRTRQRQITMPHTDASKMYHATSWHQNIAC
jgi:hypothetical protein